MLLGDGVEVANHNGTYTVSGPGVPNATVTKKDGVATITIADKAITMQRNPQTGRWEANGTSDQGEQDDKAWAEGRNAGEVLDATIRALDYSRITGRPASLEVLPGILGSVALTSQASTNEGENGTVTTATSAQEFDQSDARTLYMDRGSADGEGEENGVATAA